MSCLSSKACHYTSCRNCLRPVSHSISSENGLWALYVIKNAEEVDFAWRINFTYRAVVSKIYQAARSGGGIVFKGLYSGLAGNLAGVLPSVTARIPSLSPFHHCLNYARSQRMAPTRNQEKSLTVISFLQDAPRFCAWISISSDVLDCCNRASCLIVRCALTIIIYLRLLLSTGRRQFLLGCMNRWRGNFWMSSQITWALLHIWWETDTALSLVSVFHPPMRS